MRHKRLEKTFTDYQAQANRPFEHEAHLKELLTRQAQLNAALDLDKSDAQAAGPMLPGPELATGSVLHESAALTARRNSAAVPRPLTLIGSIVADGTRTCRKKKNVECLITS
jgi:hypothetical protein